MSRHRERYYRAVSTHLLAALMAGLWGAGWFLADSAGPAWAQAPAEVQYRTVPINPAAKKDRRLRSDVLRILREGDISGDGQFGEEEQKRLQAYYWGYSLPRWTLPEFRTELAGNPEQLAETTRGLRVELQNELRNCKSEPAFEFVTDLVLRSLENLVKPYPAGQPGFHPATRVNAMLMISELGANPPAGFGDVPPPLPDALPILLNHLKDPEQLDAVRVAALVGISRHADLEGIDTPQARQAVVTALVALINSPQPANRSADGHAWMRSQAAEILGKLGIAAAGVPNGLSAMVADANLPVSLRCVAAEALGKLNYTDASNVNPSQITTVLGRLADKAIDEELSEKKDAKEPPEMMAGGERPETTDDEEQPEFSRRRLKARLTSVAGGLTGLRPVVGPPHQDLYARVSRPVAAILTALDDRRIKDEDLRTQIEQNHQQLQAALGVGPGGAAPDATPTEPGETPEPAPPAET